MTAATLLRRSVRALVFCAGILFCAFFLCRSAQAGRTVLPGRLKTVEEEAFAGDRRLNVAVVGEGVTVIGPRAFAGSALKVVYLPASLESIAADAFDGCDGMTVISPPGCYARRWCRSKGVNWIKAGTQLLTTETTELTIRNGATADAPVTMKVEGYPLKWTSSNQKVLTVDENGKIFGVYPGKATLTAKARDLEESVKITVTVQANYRAVLFSESTFEGGVIQRNRGDVKLMTEMLNSVRGPDGGKYEIHSFDDLTAPEVYRKIETYLEVPSRDGDVSMFFFASHGDKVSRDQENAGRLFCRMKETWLPLQELAAALTLIDGKVIVLLESCGPGAAVMEFDSNGAGEADAPDNEENDLTANDMLRYFSAADPGLKVYTYDDGGEVQPNGNLFLTDKFLVMTASKYRETSYMYEGDTHNLFPVVLARGVGTSGEMPADKVKGNSDGILAFKELFDYVFNYTLYRQTACAWPSGSMYELFVRAEE